MQILSAISLVLLIAGAPLRSVDAVLQEVACKEEFSEGRRMVAGEFLYLIEFDLNGDNENELLVSSDTFKTEDDDPTNWYLYAKNDDGNYTKSENILYFSRNDIRVWRNEEDKEFLCMTSHLGRNTRLVSYLRSNDGFNVEEIELCVLDYNEDPTGGDCLNDDSIMPGPSIKELPTAEYKLCGDANRTGWRTLDDLLSVYANETRPIDYVEVPVGEKLFVIQFDIFGDTEPEVLISTETRREEKYGLYLHSEKDLLVWILYSKDDSGDYNVNMTNVRLLPEEARVCLGKSGKPELGRIRPIHATPSQFETFTEWRSVLKWRPIESFFDETSRDKWLKQHTSRPDDLIVEYPAAKYKAAPAKEESAPDRGKLEQEINPSESSPAPPAPTASPASGAEPAKP